MSNAPTQPEVALQVEGLSAGYGGTPVIESLSLTVGQGEIVAILGRNGAGKSTTLAAIAGLLKGTKGRVLVTGSQVSGPAYKRNRTALGLILEGRSVFPSLTVSQNLRVGNVNASRVFEVFPELQRRAHVKAGVLSGGEQQILSLARAIGRDPEVLLLDEVSFGLSPIVCSRIFSTLRDYVSAGRAVLLVEQSVHYAEEVADRVLIMHQGAIAIEMKASELREKEATIDRLYLGVS